MFNEQEFREAEAPLKQLKEKISELWSEHERLQAALYANSGWTAKQIAALEHKYNPPRGTYAKINRMIEFDRFMKRFGNEFPKLRFYTFERLFSSWHDNFPRIAELLRQTDKANVVAIRSQ